jgi:hypothetical protein
MKADIIRKARCRFIYALVICLTLGASFFSLGYADHVEAAAKKTYTIKPSDAPYKNNYKKNATYNEKTRHYYLLRSYLEQLEKDGGGSLILEKGKYVVTNTLYIPSNVKIVLKDGVRLVKGNDTGTKKLSPTSSIFQFIAPSKAQKSSIATKYKGESNISIVGEGKAIIDLNYIKDAVGMVLGHNSNITIRGITFLNMYGGSMIKIGASEDVTIIDNVFMNHKTSAYKNRPAINIEVPDSKTKTFSYTWSKTDKYVNRNINIEGNKFSNLEAAIVTFKYTEGKYNKNISIIDNDISDIKYQAIRVINWQDFNIERNSFSNITGGEQVLRTIMLYGAKNPTIKENTFTKVDRVIQISPWKNNDYGSEYKVTYNSISEKNKNDMQNNKAVDVGEYFIRYNKTYNEFSKDTEKWGLYDASVKDFVINPESDPYLNMFLTYNTYTSKTRQYYVIRSYLEHLEEIGGGTLTLEKGTYNITNSLYVPSNVTITLKDGVVIKKADDTGLKDFPFATPLFILAAPSKSKIEGAYGGYDGESNIKIIGEGKAVIDLAYVLDALGIVLGHNQDVLISGITFQNMYSGHFIELDASKNVVIENNVFMNHKASSSRGIKEAINVDTPDATTGGFNHIWSNHDCTPNKDIYIRNNTFDNLERAIGTHKYSGGKYHENVNIIDNIIINTTSDAIRIMNWSKPVIKGNKISRVSDGGNGKRAVFVSGAIRPVITKNIFEDVARPIQISPWKNNGTGSQYDITYNEVTVEDIALMKDNTLIRVQENYIRYNKTYDVFDKDTEKYYIY